MIKMGVVRSGSWRTAPLPPDWSKIRIKVLRRDPICRLQIVCFGAPSTEVDHINPNNHSLNNLRGVCAACHARRTGQQGARAANAKRLSRKRPPEPHPGIIARR